MAEQPLLAATTANRLIGVAVVKVGRPAAAKALKVTLPVVPRLLALTPRLRLSALRALRSVLTAMKPPHELPGPHQLLEAIAVHPDHQGCGVGSLLLSAVHRHAEQNRLVGTYWITGDVKNRDIYLHLGYYILAVKQAPGLVIYHMMRA